MFQKDRYGMDDFQRQIGENSSGSNDDSDILDGKKIK